MELPQPTLKNYTSLISNIETGQIKIPQFQRDFVRTTERLAAILDSIVKGYPIGTFIFWRTKESLNSVKNIGKIKLPAPKKGEIINFGIFEFRYTNHICGLSPTLIDSYNLNKMKIRLILPIRSSCNTR